MKYLIVLFVMIYTISTDAQVRVWGGGVGDWDNAFNWINPSAPTTFTIPGPNDHVIINNNNSVSGIELVTIPHGYTAHVKSMEIGEDAYVSVGTAGGSGVVALRVWGSPSIGIELNGFLRVWDDGVLSIQDAPDKGIEIGDTGEFDVKVGGFADLRSSNATLGTAIHNEGYVITRKDNSGGEGIINIFDYKGIGVSNKEFTANFENKGALIIANSNGDGSSAIESINDADFTNTIDGRIIINKIVGANAIGILADDLFTNEGSIQISKVDQAASIVVKSSSGLFFNANGATISVSDSEHDGIRTFNNSLFINEGEILIEDLDVGNRRGIINESTFENRSTGVINVAGAIGSTFRGIQNDWLFENEGMIIIAGVSDGIGVWNQSSNANFTNDGTMNIFNSGLDAIRNRDNANFINLGTITTSNTRYKTIANWTNASFANNGVISISGGVGELVEGINNRSGTFTNNSLGKITISNLDGVTAVGIHNDQGSFINDGEISINDIADGSCIINEEGGLINNGTLDLDRCGSHGILNSNNGLITNNNKLTINDLSMPDSDGIRVLSLSRLLNQKELKIDNVTGDGISTDWGFQNTILAELEITDFGKNGIVTASGFEASNEGSITIETSKGFFGSNGLLVLGPMSNKGAIDISFITNHSDGIRAIGELINIGSIQIDNVASTGVKIQPGGKIVNKGSGIMNIEDIDLRGLSVSGTFINEVDASLNVENVLGVGVMCRDSILNEGTINVLDVEPGVTVQIGHLDNYGTINVDAQTGQIELIVAQGTLLTNRPCAEINIKESVSVSGVVNNEGLFKMEGIVQSFLIGTFNNTGVINDFGGSFNTHLASGNTFGGVYAGYIHGYHVLGVTSFAPLLVNGGNVDIGNEYYAFENLNFPAGPYDKNRNSWLPSEVNLGVVFLEMTQVSQGQTCSKVISQKLFDSNVLGACTEIPQTYILTSRNSGVWHYPFNWSGFQVPTDCTKAVVDNFHDIAVEPIYNATARELEVKSNSTLTVFETMTIGNN